MTTSSVFIAPTRFDDAEAALAQVRLIYDTSIAHLRDSLQRFVAGGDLGARVRACYPFVRVQTSTVARADSRLSYGFVAGPGTYETTITRPDLFASYYLEQSHDAFTVSGDIAPWVKLQYPESWYGANDPAGSCLLYTSPSPRD